MVELHRLCRDGRLYDVEAWLRAGRPLQVARGVPTTGCRTPTALDIALKTTNQALIWLLLCTGYDPNLEPACPVSAAIRVREGALMDLLLTWGADPLRVAPEDVCASYNTDLLERFFTLGLDFTADHVLGHMLAEHSSNKPLFRFAKRHREDDPRIQRELTMALGLGGRLKTGQWLTDEKRPMASGPDGFVALYAADPSARKSVTRHDVASRCHLTVPQRSLRCGVWSNRPSKMRPLLDCDECSGEGRSACDGREPQSGR